MLEHAIVTLERFVVMLLKVTDPCSIYIVLPLVSSRWVLWKHALRNLGVKLSNSGLLNIPF